MPKTRVRDLPQIALYVRPGLKRKVQGEANARRRGLGPTVIEILEEYFEKPERRTDAEREESAAGGD